MAQTTLVHPVARAGGPGAGRASAYVARRRAAIRAAGEKGLQITRFKGLGEISPNEFGPFIGPDMRLLPVNVDNVREIDGMLGFFMGDNTPSLRDYIMENLR